MLSGIWVAGATKEGADVMAYPSRVVFIGSWLVLLSLLTLLSCSRPDAVPSNQDTSQTQQLESPFQSQEDGTAATLSPIVASAQKLTSVAHVSRKSGSAHELQSVPPGTLVTVQLKRAVYAGMSPTDASFEAVVAEPVVVAGNILIPIGASAAGRVESARTSHLRPDRGYVRLALKTLQLGNRLIPVQTDSLFAREAPMGDSPISAIHLEKGRRLTFRLIDTTFSSDQGPYASQ